METKNLKFCMMTAYGKHAHSQTPVRLMVDLGIKWESMDRELFQGFLAMNSRKRNKLKAKRMPLYGSKTITTDGDSSKLDWALNGVKENGQDLVDRIRGSKTVCQ